MFHSPVIAAESVQFRSTTLSLGLKTVQQVDSVEQSRPEKHNLASEVSEKDRLITWKSNGRGAEI